MAVIVQFVSICQNGALQYIPVLPEWPRPQSQFILACYSRPCFISFSKVAPHPPPVRDCHFTVTYFGPSFRQSGFVESYSRQAGNRPTGIFDM